VDLGSSSEEAGERASPYQSTLGTIVFSQAGSEKRDLRAALASLDSATNTTLAPR
jgi:hypothetical protein